MVLRFCQMHGLICHVYHNAVQNGNELESYSPPDANSNTSRVDFFVRDDETPCMAKNAISQMWKDPVDEDEDEFKDKELLPFFTQGDGVPPFSEWLSSSRLTGDAPKFDTFKMPPRERTPMES